MDLLKRKINTELEFIIFLYLNTLKAINNCFDKFNFLVLPDNSLLRKINALCKDYFGLKTTLR